MLGEVSSRHIEHDGDFWDWLKVRGPKPSPSPGISGADEETRIVWAYEKLGLQPDTDRPTGHHPFYQHDFLKKLRAEFPKSKYAEEIRFLTVAYPEYQRTGLSDAPEKFLKECPNSRFSAFATLLVARIHDSRWSHDETLKKSPREKAEALHYYQAATKLPLPHKDHWWVTSHEIDDAKKRIIGLEKGIPAPFDVTTND